MDPGNGYFIYIRQVSLPVGILLGPYLLINQDLT